MEQLTRVLPLGKCGPLVGAVHWWVWSTGGRGTGLCKICVQAYVSTSVRSLIAAACCWVGSIMETLTGTE